MVEICRMKGNSASASLATDPAKTSGETLIHFGFAEEIPRRIAKNFHKNKAIGNFQSWRQSQQH